jgi:hypothetical protein
MRSRPSRWHTSCNARNPNRSADRAGQTRGNQVAFNNGFQGQKVSVRTLTVFIFTTLFAIYAQAQEVAIPIPNSSDPLKNIRTPANDLVYQGKVIDSDQATDLLKTGFDLSTLDPEANDAWKPQSLPIEDLTAPAIPENSTLSFIDTYPALPFMARAVVEQGGETYHLIFYGPGHTALLRNALLRRMGYPIPSPQNLKTSTLSFKTKEAKEEFLFHLKDQVQFGNLKDFWIAGETETSLQLKDVIIQNARVLVPPFHWGAWTAAGIRGRRALRSLIIPFALSDLPQGVNTFAWEAGNIISNHVLLKQEFAEEFTETSWDDSRWAVRKIAALTKADWQAIVKAGRYPEDIAALIVEKLVARRNHLVELFGFGNLFPKLSYDVNITVGAVKQGKATQQWYPGYAVKFTYGDVENPLTKSEIFRFFKLESIAVGMAKLIGRANEFLDIRNVNNLAQKHSEDMIKSLQNHIASHQPGEPLKPYSAPLQTWGGPIGSFSVNASRNVVSGTFFGIEDDKARVQLADNIGVQASLGYFMGIDGIKNIGIGVHGNVGLQRNYIHVRPVPSMKAADKEAWKKLFIPNFMKSISDVIDPKAPYEKAQAAMVKFMEEDLQKNEMFVIVDSLSGGVGANISIPVFSLLSLPIGGTATLSSSTSQNIVLLRRTTFLKTSDGELQVYVQNIKSQAFNQTFDFKWFVNIWSWSGTLKTGDANSKVFHLPFVQKLDGDTEETFTPAQERKNRMVMSAVKALLRNNDRDLLEEEFAPYELNHELTAKIQRKAFLWKRWDKAEETHVVRVKPPPELDENGKPKFDPNEHERTLASFQVVKRKGNNYYALVADIINSFAQGYGPKSAGGSNPSSTFFGNGNWTNFRTEAELTAGYDFQPVTAIESYWAGWSIPKKQLFKILDILEKRIVDLNLGKPIVRRDEFAATDSLKFFEIRANLVVYKSGMQKIREKLSPAKGEEKRVFNELVQLAGEEYVNFCRLAKKTFGENGVQKYYGDDGEYACALPWMKKLLDLRRSVPQDDRLKELKWATKAVEALDENVKTSVWLNWVGKEHFNYAIKVSGFMSNNEEKDHSYVSDMVGTIDPKLGNGIFSEFVSKYKIMGYEMNARYLNEGF